MKRSSLLRLGCTLLFALACPLGANAQSTAPATLAVSAGRSLDIRLDQRLTIKRVGQQISGVVMQPVYVYDRIVVPEGTKAFGQVASLENPPKITRLRAWLSGDLSPARRVVLRFDTLMLPSGETLSVDSIATNEIPRPTRASAPERADASDTNIVGRARQEATDRAKAAIAEAKQRGHELLSEIHQPGKGARLKDALIQRLPYHPQIVNAGTGYHVELNSPLTFGRFVPGTLAPSDKHPAPSSLLNARLLTELNSAKTPRGTLVRAVVSEPVFSSDQQLLVPEGTMLEGEVTLAKRARWLHRNGQLRFLFETVHRNADESGTMFASLQSIETNADDRVALDEEGGATLGNTKTRFIAPALAVLALRGGLDHHDHLDPDGDGHIIQSGHSGALGVGGFLGLGVLGAVIGPMSRPVGLTLSIIGVGRTLFSNVLGRGREVTFAADTPMQLQLAPGPSPEP